MEDDTKSRRPRGDDAARQVWPTHRRDLRSDHARRYISLRRSQGGEDYNYRCRQRDHHDAPDDVSGVQQDYRHEIQPRERDHAARADPVDIHREFRYGRYLQLSRCLCDARFWSIERALHAIG